MNNVKATRYIAHVIFCISPSGYREKKKKKKKKKTSQVSWASYFPSEILNHPGKSKHKAKIKGENGKGKSEKKQKRKKGENQGNHGNV